MIHAENKNIKSLLPLLTEYISGGLSALIEGEKSFAGTALQKYAHDVYSRVVEIDYAFQGLSLSIEYLHKKSYQDSEYEFAIHHSYHVENFILRLTGIVDRCHLLAGSTVLLADESIERFGGNRIVIRKLSKISPESVSLLSEIDNKVKEFRDIRNALAHASGYSNKNLAVLSVIEGSDDKLKEKFNDIMPISSLKAIVAGEAVDMFAPVLP